MAARSDAEITPTHVGGNFCNFFTSGNRWVSCPSAKWGLLLNPSVTYCRDAMGFTKGPFITPPWRLYAGGIISNGCTPDGCRIHLQNTSTQTTLRWWAMHSVARHRIASHQGPRIMGAPEVPPSCRETSVSRTANVGTWFWKRNGGQKWVKVVTYPVYPSYTSASLISKFVYNTHLLVESLLVENV